MQVAHPVADPNPSQTLIVYLPVPVLKLNRDSGVMYQRDTV